MSIKAKMPIWGRILPLRHQTLPPSLPHRRPAACQDVNPRVSLDRSNFEVDLVDARPLEPSRLPATNPKAVSHDTVPRLFRTLGVTHETCAAPRLSPKTSDSRLFGFLCVL
ncbi:uncharacterized protein ATNIH1004_002555 [Aspergillus tanneri]|uniref:Uncharacterized protein n=1 Tax=Aspergillus tanneri TaxID=1220188 RepID=A0A5M9MVC6_9EURO|nr:uncharacterized protein ATNIH1004_002555 [Aspergillus tanneri]KAA8649876.1 hypothetical protein ATNIH1004_002555 [Aspergillus tanneri]